VNPRGGAEPLIEPAYTMNFIWLNQPAAVSGTRTDSFVLMNLSNRKFNRSLSVSRTNYTRCKETKLRGLSSTTKPNSFERDVKPSPLSRT
jgi:hypothetical protein